MTYWALAEMAKAQAGIFETDTPEEAERKLAEAVSALGADDSERMLENLRPLVGIVAEGEVGGDKRAERFAAWRQFFEALADQRPAVLVFEDLHWADDDLLDFVDHLVDWGDRGGAARRVRHPSGAPRAAAGLGRREAERRHVVGLAALRRGDSHVCWPACSIDPCFRPICR